MKYSQWYRNNYGLIVFACTLFSLFLYAHVDLIDTGLIVENVKEEINKQAENNGEPYTDSQGNYHNV